MRTDTAMRTRLKAAAGPLALVAGVGLAGGGAPGASLAQIALQGAVGLALVGLGALIANHPEE